MVFAWVLKKMHADMWKKGVYRVLIATARGGQTTTKSLISKTRTLQTFCYSTDIFKPSLHYVQFLNFTFHGGRKHATTNIYFFFPNLDMCDMKTFFAVLQFVNIKCTKYVPETLINNLEKTVFCSQNT